MCLAAFLEEAPPRYSAIAEQKNQPVAQVENNMMATESPKNNHTTQHHHF